MTLQEEVLRLGVAGVICLILIWALLKGEKREEKKDARIQLLENQLRESYDERVAAADRISEAIHDNAIASNNAAAALQGLTEQMKELKRHPHG